MIFGGAGLAVVVGVRDVIGADVVGAEETGLDGGSVTGGTVTTGELDAAELVTAAGTGDGLELVDVLAVQAERRATASAPTITDLIRVPCIETVPPASQVTLPRVESSESVVRLQGH
jgi:hypothetical protein